MTMPAKEYKNRLVAENREQIEEHIRQILRLIGEDVDREGLLDTPARVTRMYEEIFAAMRPTSGRFWAWLSMKSTRSLSSSRISCTTASASIIWRLFFRQDSYRVYSERQDCRTQQICPARGSGDPPIAGTRENHFGDCGYYRRGAGAARLYGRRGRGAPVHVRPRCEEAGQQDRDLCRSGLVPQ